MATVKFSDVVKRANTKEDRFNTDKIYYVGGEHIISNELSIREKGLIKGSTIGPMFYFGFKKGQVLFVSRNPHLRKAAVAEFDGICSEKTFVLETADESRLLQDYLIVVMRSDDLWDYLEENKNGGVNYFINWSTLANYEFELPSLQEQKVIANKVWSAYRLKESYVELLNASRELVKSQFIEMFGWEDSILLSHLAQYSIGLTYKPADISDDGIIVLRSGNIQDGKIDLSDIVRVSCPIKTGLLVSQGDILMCSRNGSASLVGKTAIIPKIEEVLSFGAFMTIIRSEYSEYLNAFFQTHLFRNQIKAGKSSTMNQITQKMLDSIRVPFPKNKKSLDEFSAFARQADKSEFELKQAIESIDKVIKSLINQQECL